MTKRVISPFVTLVGSKSVGWWDKSARRAEKEAEQASIRQSLIEWLADSSNEDSEEYSDIFKEVYGVRP